ELGAGVTFGSTSRGKRCRQRLRQRQRHAPLVVGPLQRARELEGFQFVLMTMQANPEFADFNWDTGLQVTK
ncbi:MAG TPA: hypothetical protein VK883_08670, partial [Arthrobacter sp.]|nr:hypothetical protein [Arthrobacter sp.]